MTVKAFEIRLKSIISWSKLFHDLPTDIPVAISCASELTCKAWWGCFYILLLRNHTACGDASGRRVLQATQSEQPSPHFSESLTYPYNGTYLIRLTRLQELTSSENLVQEYLWLGQHRLLAPRPVAPSRVCTGGREARVCMYWIAVEDTCHSLGTEG